MAKTNKQRLEETPPASGRLFNEAGEVVNIADLVSALVAGATVTVVSPTGVAQTINADGSADVSVVSTAVGAVAIKSIADSATELSYTIGEEQIRLDNLIGAAAGDTVRMYCPTDVRIGWGATAIAATANGTAPGSGVAGGSIYFAAGTELVKIPAELVGEIWLSIDAITTSGTANIVLVN